MNHFVKECASVSESVRDFSVKENLNFFFRRFYLMINERLTEIQKLCTHILIKNALKLVLSINFSSLLVKKFLIKVCQPADSPPSSSG